MGAIQLKNVRKKFGNDVVIDNLNLEIKDGSFTVLVGPSGCGKSTTLRMITGLDEPTSGDILIDGHKINDLTPGKRDIAMVFQNYALYPTMTVRENIEFGLENKKVPKEERQRRVKDICEIVGLTEYLDRKPSTLSGGQRQRVALARAMVKQPKVFLMDEPLSNLDAKLRGQMRVELISLHKKLGTTFVYVTHDQVEAMSMADDIVLMKDGYIVQQSNPRQLYQNPTCIYAAQFIGTPQMNIISNVLPDGMQLGFRPEKVYLQRVEEDYVSIQAEVVTKEMLGSETIYSLSSVYGTLMVKSEHEVENDCLLDLSIPFSAMYLFNREGKRADLGQPERHIHGVCIHCIFMAYGPGYRISEHDYHEAGISKVPISVQSVHIHVLAGTGHGVEKCGILCTVNHGCPADSTVQYL